MSKRRDSTGNQNVSWPEPKRSRLDAVALSADFDCIPEQRPTPELSDAVKNAYKQRLSNGPIKIILSSSTKCRLNTSDETPAADTEVNTNVPYESCSNVIILTQQDKNYCIQNNNDSHHTSTMELYPAYEYNNNAIPSPPTWSDTYYYPVTNTCSATTSGYHRSEECTHYNVTEDKSYVEEVEKFLAKINPDNNCYRTRQRDDENYTCRKYDTQSVPEKLVPETGKVQVKKNRKIEDVKIRSTSPDNSNRKSEDNTIQLRCKTFSQQNRKANRESRSVGRYSNDCSEHLRRGGLSHRTKELKRNENRATKKRARSSSSEWEDRLPKKAHEKLEHKMNKEKTIGGSQFNEISNDSQRNLHREKPDKIKYLKDMLDKVTQRINKLKAEKGDNEKKSTLKSVVQVINNSNRSVDLRQKLLQKGLPQESLVITINNEEEVTETKLDLEEREGLVKAKEIPIVEKCKKIKIYLKVCSSSEYSNSDDDFNETSDRKTDYNSDDLSFLDDINADEIANMIHNSNDNEADLSIISTMTDKETNPHTETISQHDEKSTASSAVGKKEIIRKDSGTSTIRLDEFPDTHKKENNNDGNSYTISESERNIFTNKSQKEHDSQFSRKEIKKEILDNDVIVLDKTEAEKSNRCEIKEIKNMQSNMKEMKAIEDDDDCLNIIIPANNIKVEPNTDEIVPKNKNTLPNAKENKAIEEKDKGGQDNIIPANKIEVEPNTNEVAPALDINITLSNTGEEQVIEESDKNGMKNIIPANKINVKPNTNDVVLKLHNRNTFRNKEENKQLEEREKHGENDFVSEIENDLCCANTHEISVTLVSKNSLYSKEVNKTIEKKNTAVKEMEIDKQDTNVIDYLKEDTIENDKPKSISNNTKLKPQDPKSKDNGIKVSSAKDTIKAVVSKKKHTRISPPNRVMTQLNNNASPLTFSPGFRKDERIFVEKLAVRMQQCFQDRFTITSVIHRGKFSKVLHCKGPKNRDYAIKMLRNNIVDQVDRTSIEMLVALQREISKENLNIIKVYDCLPVVGSWCILMEYFPKNLSEAIEEKGGSFHIKLVQHLSKQLVAAVITLKSYNVVHSDIKPSHVLLNSTYDRLKLCGFDRALYGQARRQILPNTGTVNYRAPEIILGFSADYKIDVWSAALVMYEMATKRQLFPGIYNNDILHKQICTLGYVPNEMIRNGRFANKHFIGSNFKMIVNKMSADGPTDFKIKSERQFYKNNVLRATVKNEYYQVWSRGIPAMQKAEEIYLVDCFCNLLEDMLAMHPKYRMPIELVRTNTFLN